VQGNVIAPYELETRIKSPDLTANLSARVFEITAVVARAVPAKLSSPSCNEPLSNKLRQDERTASSADAVIGAAGEIIFIPAAMTRTYEIFLIGLFTIGAGLAILQTAANPYITVLGPKESAAQRISIMGICNKGAGIIAPLVFAAVVLKATDTDLFAQLPLMNTIQKYLILLIT
jgi:MFS family permease